MNKNIFLIGLLLGAVVMFNVARAVLGSDDISIKKNKVPAAILAEFGGFED